MKGFPFAVLRAPLSAAERRAIDLRLRGLLSWQKSLARWPAPRGRGIVDATPFVSVYVDGRLCGCYGAVEGAPAERLARAALLALHDGRFPGPVGARERVVLEAAYPLEPRRVTLSRLDSVLEPGVHGLGFARAGSPPVLLLPSVARDGGFDSARLAAIVASKAGLPPEALPSGKLFVCHVETVVTRSAPGPAPARGATCEALARSWLERVIRPDGEIEFGIDPHTGAHTTRGEFHHGRAALVLRALRAGSSNRVRRARAWLERELRRALRGHEVAGFPEHPAQVAGTFALAALAGIDVAAPLGVLAKDRRVAENVWHAAQVVLALGNEAPRQLWRACVAELERHPWAPWTALAARRLGDARVLARTERALTASIRAREPFRGGAAVRSIPEVALTALVVEALDGGRGPDVARAIRDAQAFLRRVQCLAPVPGAYDPASALGGFPLSPVLPYQRSDVTAHVLGALRAKVAWETR